MSQTFDRYANAPVLPFTRGRSWFLQARAVWRRHMLFLLMATLAVLVARWQLDFYDRAVLIVFSYLSDAVVFTWVFLGLRNSEAAGTAPAFAPGWRALKGRWLAVMLSSLWGLPAALASYALFAFGPELIKALVLAVGVNSLGVAALLLLLLAGGYVTFLLCMLPVLAGVHVAGDALSGFRVGGLWAFRGLRAGWRPLMVVFLAFITACFVAGTALTWGFGHLPAQWFVADDGFIDWLQYWYPWPGLLVAMNIFLALLYPMARDLLGAADIDLSDEIASDEQKDSEGQRFIGFVLEQAALVVRAASALCVLFGLLYAVFMAELAQFFDWLWVAFILYVIGGGLYKLAARWRVAKDAVAALPTDGNPFPGQSLSVKVILWVGKAVLWLLALLFGAVGGVLMIASVLAPEYTTADGDFIHTLGIGVLILAGVFFMLAWWASRKKK